MRRVRTKKTKAEIWHGKTMGEMAEAESSIFIARYSDSAERVAELVLQKIRAQKKIKGDNNGEKG